MCEPEGLIEPIRCARHANGCANMHLPQRRARSRRARPRRHCDARFGHRRVRVAQSYRQSIRRIFRLRRFAHAELHALPFAAFAVSMPRRIPRFAISLRAANNCAKERPPAPPPASTTPRTSASFSAVFIFNAVKTDSTATASGENSCYKCRDQPVNFAQPRRIADARRHFQRPITQHPRHAALQFDHAIARCARYRRVYSQHTNFSDRAAAVRRNHDGHKCTCVNCAHTSNF